MADLFDRIRDSEKITELKSQLRTAISQTHYFGDQARREFDQCLSALESGTSEDIIEALRDGPLGCGTESSHFDSRGVQDLAMQLCQLLED
jgi:hypothetical protein